MGFSLEPQREKLQERAVQGYYRRVAVLCWFTSSGRVMPQMLKYEDEEGLLHTVSPISVISYDQRHYAGIMSQKYNCRAEFDGNIRNFVLMFHPDNTIWDLVFQA